MADINARIRLDGEAQFRRQITDSKNAVKSLDSELALAEQQFRDTGNAESFMQERARLLNEKLQAQQRAVDTAKQALERLKSQGYDANDAAVLTWRGHLANAERNVLSLSREIENNKNGLDAAGRSYTEMGEKAETAGGKVEGLNQSLQNVDRGITLQNVSEALENINGAIDRGISRAVRLGKALWNMTADSTQWADELQTLSETTGIDTTTLQQWEYAARFVDTEVDTIIGARQRLTRNLGSEDLANLGVETRDAGGELRDVTDIMWDALTAIGGIENETERSAAAMAIFGRSADDLMPLIRAGREEWDRLSGSAPVISDENLAKLTTANDALENLDAQLNNAKTTLLAQLAPALSTIADRLSGALEQLGEFLETEEGQAKLQGFSDAVVHLAENLLDIDWGQAIQTASDALTSITDALEWIANHKEAVIAALGAIAGARIWGTITSAAVNVEKLISFFGHGATGGAVGSAATGTAGSAVTGVSTASAAGGTGVSTLSGLGLHLPAGLGHIMASGTGAFLGIAALSGLAYWAGTKNEYLDEGNGRTGMSGLAEATEEERLALREFRALTDEERALIEARERELDAEHAARGDEHWARTAFFGNYNAAAFNSRAYAERAAAAMQGGASASSQFRWLAENAGGAGGFMNMWSYEDSRGNSRNYLEDLLRGIDYQEGDNQQLMAAIYREWASVFGEITSSRGAAALAELPTEMQEALRQGAGAFMQIIASGAGLDDSYLALYMRDFFQRSGIYDSSGRAQVTQTGTDYRTRREQEAAAHGATTGITFVPDPRVTSQGAAETTYGMTYQDILAQHGYSANWTPDFSQPVQEAVDNALDAYAEIITGLVLNRTQEGREQSGESDGTEIAGIVAGALNGAHVEMDGRVVGRLVAPTVADVLSRESMMR